MQLFGFRKTPDLSLAPLQASALETCGLRSGDGRLLVAAARSHILANPPYTRDLLSTISGLSSREGLSTRAFGPRSRRRVAVEMTGDVLPSARALRSLHPHSAVLVRIAERQIGGG